MSNVNLKNLSLVNMEILSFDYVELTKKWKSENMCSPYTRIYIVTNGVGYLWDNKSKIKMTKGNVYIIPAGHYVSYACEDNFCKIFFHISMRLPSGYDIFENFDHLIYFQDEERISKLFDCVQINSVKKIMETKHYLYSIICRCIEGINDMPIKNNSELVIKIKSIIEKNLSINLTVNDIADKLFISPSAVRKTFKEEMGISIGKYIDDSIMIAAEYNVRNSNMSIHQISEKLGFCDQFYFSRRFSQKFGIAPMHYRRVQRYKVK